MLAVPIKEIMRQLHSRIKGQDEALVQIEKSLTKAAAGLGDPEKPIGVLFFAGPTGVGKTQTAETLADILGGNSKNICRIDGQTLQDRFTATALTSSPPGYVGSQEGDTLLNKKKIEGSYGRPGVLLLDEIEKAHPRVLNVLLGIFDKGILHLVNGKESINFSNAIIIMTSNIGSKELADEMSENKLGFKHSAGKQRDDEVNPHNQVASNLVDKEMRKTFRPEFINRFDAKVVFRWLTQEEQRQVARIFIGELNNRLKKHYLSLAVSDEVVKYLVAKGYDQAYGVKPIKRIIGSELEYPISEMKLAEYIPGTKYIVDLDAAGRLIFRKEHNRLVRRSLAALDKTKAPIPDYRALTLSHQQFNIVLTLGQAEVFDLWSPILGNREVMDHMSGLNLQEMADTFKVLAEVLREIKPVYLTEGIQLKLIIQCILFVKGVLLPSVFRKRTMLLAAMEA